ncbi:hypothetical protein BYT27DRAFT_7213073 [Phlegmacium glaucopus]|nr:hypothetical protein BYT27DRAFT_7213073 [Phlegmacium glaucopus]
MTTMKGDPSIKIKCDFNEEILTSELHVDEMDNLKHASNLIEDKVVWFSTAYDDYHLLRIVDDQLISNEDYPMPEPVSTKLLPDKIAVYCAFHSSYVQVKRSCQPARYKHLNKAESDCVTFSGPPLHYPQQKPVHVYRLIAAETLGPGPPEIFSASPQQPLPAPLVSCAPSTKEIFISRVLVL